MDSLGITYGDSLVHVTWYQAFGPLEIATPEGDARSVRYNVAGLWPSVYFDGFDKAPQISDSFYTVYRDFVDLARSRATVLEMSLDPATTVLDSATMGIGVHITPTDSSLDAARGLMLVAVVVEDSAPYYSPLRGDTAYARFCARKVVGDTWGIPVSLKFGTDFDTVLTTSIGSWRPERLGVAVFVQDTATNRVLQSVGIRRFPTMLK